MLTSLFLLFLAAQTAPAQDASQDEEIVVRATFGHTTMLFDKGADGRLHNCRIMVSSGSQRRDTDACQATPVCYAKTADEVTDCRELTVLEMAATIGAPGEGRPGGSNAVQVFTLPPLGAAKAVSLSPGQAGPLEITDESKETERQRVKLPPLPKSPNSEPVVRITGGNTQDSQRDNRP